MTTPSGSLPSTDSRRVDLESLSLHLRIAGDGGAPLILLHGLGGDSTSWTLNQRQLAARRQVIAPDLPGHGQSDRTIGDGTVPAIAEMLRGLPDALGIDRFHLLGLSFGGGVALHLAGLLTHRILSLTCVSTTGLGHACNTSFIRGYLRAETPEDMRPWLELLFHDKRKVNDAMVGYALYGRRDPGLRDCVDRMTDANFRNGGQRYGYRDALAGFPFPVRILWGREDCIVPVAHAAGLPEHIETHILDDIGHMPNAEAADTFNALVDEWLLTADP